MESKLQKPANGAMEVKTSLSSSKMSSKMFRNWGVGPSRTPCMQSRVSSMRFGPLNDALGATGFRYYEQLEHQEKVINKIRFIFDDSSY